MLPVGIAAIVARLLGHAVAVYVGLYESSWIRILILRGNVMTSVAYDEAYFVESFSGSLVLLLAFYFLFSALCFLTLCRNNMTPPYTCALLLLLHSYFWHGGRLGCLIISAPVNFQIHISINFLDIILSSHRNNVFWKDLKGCWTYVRKHLCGTMNSYLIPPIHVL